MALYGDSLYGNLLAAGPMNKPEPMPSVPSPPGKEDGDNMFSAPPGGKPVKSPKEEPAAALPQAFSAAKLMMPPVRKKAEPVAAGKRPMMTGLDIAKLQEEKEALMRQRAAAAAPDKPASAGFSGSSSGGANLDGVPISGDDNVPASASTASVSTVATAGNTTVSGLYGNPDEEYDPAKPNDYDEFCRRRMRMKAEEEMEKRRQDMLTRQKIQAEPEKPKEDDFATKMMKKMGWKDGQGLGKEGQGMATPLVLQKTDQRVGKIVEGSQKREAPAAQPQAQPDAKQAKAGFNRAPTRILLLNNLVGAGEVDEDLEEETGEEAGKYGKLKRCVIKEVKGLPDTEAVRIFLEYEKVESATKALVDMNGRFFGGRRIRARFFCEDRYAKGDLDKKDDE